MAEKSLTTASPTTRILALAMDISPGNIQSGINERSCIDWVFWKDPYRGSRPAEHQGYVNQEHTQQPDSTVA